MTTEAYIAIASGVVSIIGAIFSAMTNYIVTDLRDRIVRLEGFKMRRGD